MSKPRKAQLLFGALAAASVLASASLPLAQGAPAGPPARRPSPATPARSPPWPPTT